MNTSLQTLKDTLYRIKHFSLEEKIIQISLLTSLISCFLPWLTNKSNIYDDATFTALGFNTSYIGYAIILLLSVNIALVLVPTIANKHVISVQHRQYVRFHASLITTILILAILSIYTKMTSESALISIRYGVYITLIGSLISNVYTWYMWNKKLSTYSTAPLASNTNSKSETLRPIIPGTPSVESHNPLRK